MRAFIKAALTLMCVCIILLHTGCSAIQQKTTEILPNSAEVELVYGDYEIELTKEQQDDIYSTFSALLRKVTECKHADVSQTTKLPGFRLEFEYQGTYRYIGATNTETPLSKGDFRFDGMVLGLYDSYMEIVPQKNGKHYYPDDAVTYIWCDDYQSALKTVVDMTVEGRLGVARNPVDLKPVQVESFLEKPSSIVIYHNEKALELSGEQAEALRGRFLPVLDHIFVDITRSSTDPTDILGYMTQNICIEFRYDQRQHLNGTIASQTEEELSFLYSEYDAMLFIIAPNGVIKPVRYFDGEYLSTSITSYSWVVDETACSAFEEYINRMIA